MCTKNEVSRSKNEEVSLCWVYPPLQLVSRWEKWDVEFLTTDADSMTN